jgi:hypothetical protein
MNPETTGIETGNRTPGGGNLAMQTAVKSCCSPADGRAALSKLDRPRVIPTIKGDPMPFSRSTRP